MSISHRPRQLPSPSAARAIRLAADVSQRQVAAELGVNRVSVARWELGDRRPRGELRRRYAALLEELQEVTGAIPPSRSPVVAPSLTSEVIALRRLVARNQKCIDVLWAAIDERTRCLTLAAGAVRDGIDAMRRVQRLLAEAKVSRRDIQAQLLRVYAQLPVPQVPEVSAVVAPEANRTGISDAAKVPHMQGDAAPDA